ncbi:DNA polymerase III subunit alpha [Sediminicurvatus halobius]|uniref:DNA polymerase III subunit alpha n=1 Tax=Sediminicurvatus halobius TaxID=2182432 RepID=A0A2U2N4A4_9GAMM|nr:DNA polymerase III subunit alpha [Spiribacter halobius]PWG63922.1 DNA polymerase III subunit alpha [Spiribacter halobius]UEX76334.1 DNA polymerase III subunit alpha [Spiribacter halobius]
MPAGFVHLHLHTEFSLIDGIVRVKPLVQAAASSGMPAVAVTDQGNLFGMVKFYRAALAAGVKPLIGADLRIAAPEGKGHDVMTFLCMDDTGYGSLTRLITASYLEGQGSEGLPVVQRAWLEQWHEGLIALSGAARGDVGRALVAGQESLARERLDWWTALLGDRYYLELQRTGRPGDEDQVHGAVALAAAADVPVVATNDVRFLQREDFEAHEARVCIHEGRVLHDERRPRRYSEEQYLRGPEEMAELFADIPESLENTLAIAQRCNLSLTLGQNVLPDFPVPAGMGIDDYLRTEAEAGLERRLARIIPADAEDPEGTRRYYRERLERELGVISQMGFPGYFLIVADFIRWAKQQDIPVGPGRGSGAGSLVAYALDITDLDPLRYDLLFERFLNPERVSMPDFDVDFCMEKRDRVIDYVADRYGREKVSQIATHGTMAARAVVRDVGRVLGHAYGYVDRIAKLIPFELGMTLEKALAQEEDLRALYDGDEEVRTLLDLARRLEGLSRNVGKHAGGVVIAPSDLTDFAPLYCEPGGGGLATQFDKDDVEAVGLVKFDFLGLRTLTIIDWTVRAVNAIRAGRGESALDIGDIPLDDPGTFELLKDCQTTAVFQLESRGMKDLIRRLRPDSFEDIIALVALFRPGPLQSGMVDDFIDRKHGRKPVAYPTPELHHDALRPILKPTYGVILYQEQVMQIAQAVGGYSLGGADLLRRAMGKKKPEEMAKQRQIFLQGATAQGLQPAHAEGLFDLMETFAGYGFNKSHSAAYALLSYQTAWLKRHYPAAFMAAVLSSDMDNTDKVVTLIDECRSMALAVEPPDVNRSAWMFQARDERTIVYGLGAVKGVGHAAIEAVVEARDAGGPFADLFDLCRRIDLRRANRRVLEALIRSGSLDSLTPNRASAMAWLGRALQAAEQQTRNRQLGQDDMFGLGSAAAEADTGSDLASVAEWPEQERLAAEKDTLGLYLTGHPIEEHEAELGAIVSCRLKQAAAGAGGTAVAGEGNGHGRRREGERRVVVAGLVVALRARLTQSGKRLGFLTLDDRTARLEVILFGDAYQRYRHLLAKDRLLVVEGDLGYDEFSDGYRVSAERVLDMTEAREAFARRLVIGVDAARAGNGFVPALREALTEYREGHCPVWIDYHGEGAEARLRLGDDWRVRPTDDLVRRLESLVAPGAVRLDYS